MLIPGSGKSLSTHLNSPAFVYQQSKHGLQWQLQYTGNTQLQRKPRASSLRQRIFRFCSLIRQNGVWKKPNSTSLIIFIQYKTVQLQFHLYCIKSCISQLCKYFHLRITRKNNRVCELVATRKYYT